VAKKKRARRTSGESLLSQKSELGRAGASTHGSGKTCCVSGNGKTAACVVRSPKEAGKERTSPEKGPAWRRTSATESPTEDYSLALGEGPACFTKEEGEGLGARRREFQRPASRSQPPFCWVQWGVDPIRTKTTKKKKETAVHGGGEGEGSNSAT